MIEKIDPTIHKGYSIYKTGAGGGGGGGGAIIDPSLYEQHFGIKRESDTFYFITNDFSNQINFNDKIIIDYYFAPTSRHGQTFLIVLNTNLVDINIGRSSATSSWFRFNGTDVTVTSPVPGYFTLKLSGGNGSINGKNNNKTVSYTNANITEFFYSSNGDSVGSIIFSFIIKDVNDNIKCQYTPVKRIADGKIGLYDPITDNFVRAYGTASFVG
jgi:hypothetical protein